ncbi:MAG TPA: SGNH/GDSL hydrolase family protein [Thermoanaerobaculia bacterium]|nr:SGNH/GDSL hydrolase family protein [Thermoanaerobaculia bacterium]
MYTSLYPKEEGGQIVSLQERRQQLRPRKKLLFAGILVLVSCLLGFIGLETYLRIAKPVDLYVATGRVAGPSPMGAWAVVDGFSAYRAKPGVQAAGKTVNRHGFISTPDLPMSKPPDTVRILFLGESSTAGMGVNLKDSDTWPWKTVEEIRRRTGRKVDFINGAAGGYTTFESYGRFWSRLRHFSPDIVVVHHGWNDMYYFGEVDRITSWRTLPDGSWSFDRPGKLGGRYAPYAIDPFLRWSQALTRVRLELSSHMGGEYASPGNRPPAHDFDHRGLEIFRTNLKLFRETSEVLGSRLVVAKQATLMVPGASPEQRELCRYDYHGFDYDAHVEAFRGLYRVIEDEIPADSIVDVTPVSGRPDLFYDHIHPTPKGTTEVARIMSDFLVPLIEHGVTFPGGSAPGAPGAPIARASNRSPQSGL